MRTIIKSVRFSVPVPRNILDALDRTGLSVWHFHPGFGDWGGLHRFMRSMYEAQDDEAWVTLGRVSVRDRERGG